MSREFNNNANIRVTNNPNAPETSARIRTTAVNANLLVVSSLFKWHKVHFYCTSKKTQVRYTELNGLHYYIITNERIIQRSHYSTVSTAG